VFINKDKDHFKYGINQWTGEPNKPVFYTKEMAIKFKELIKDLPDLLVDIAQYPEFLAIRLYEDNFLQFHGTRKEIAIDRVMKIKSMIESYGVRCELEGKPSERIL